MAPDREYAEAGALMSYGPDGKELARRAAGYVARIKPWNLPVEQPTKVELVINLLPDALESLTILGAPPAP